MHLVEGQQRWDAMQRWGQIQDNSSGWSVTGQLRLVAEANHPGGCLPRQQFLPASCVRIEVKVADKLVTVVTNAVKLGVWVPCCGLQMIIGHRLYANVEHFFDQRKQAVENARKWKIFADFSLFEPELRSNSFKFTSPDTFAHFLT